ncbi:MAG: hypothetical protein EXR58_00205 [Chloroflexi bacterium]|nr:hypothetical protein [Chloroflexota bacterium]
MRTVQSFSKHLTHFDFLLTLGLALFLRSWQIDLTQFDYDQSTLLGHLATFVATHQIPASDGLVFKIGIRHPPLFTFLLAPIGWFTLDPAWISAYQAAIDAVGALFLVLLGRDLGGRWTGLACGLLYAVSPAALLYSRRIWNPDLVPFFCAVGLWGTVGFAKFGDSRRLAAAVFALGCAAQLHLSASVLLLVPAFLAIKGRAQLSLRPLAFAGGLVGLSLAPYVLLQIQSGGYDVEQALRYLQGPKTVATEVPYLAASVVAGDLPRQVLTEGRLQDWTFLWEPGTALTMALLGLGTVFAFRQSSGWILPVWCLLPLAAALRADDWVWPHYLLPMLPSAVVLTGFGVARLKPWPISAGLLAWLVLWRVAGEAHFLDSVANLEFGPAYGIPLRYSAEAARLALVSTTGPLFMGQPEAAGGIFNYLTGDRLPIGHFDNRNTVVLRSGGGRYLVEATGHATAVLAQHLGPAIATVSTPTGGPVYQLFDVRPDLAQTEIHRATTSDINLDIGHLLRLRAFAPPTFANQQPAAAAIVTWEVTDGNDPRWGDLFFTAHLVDARGQR